jgi:hypothetical protein
MTALELFYFLLFHSPPSPLVYAAKLTALVGSEGYHHQHSCEQNFLTTGGKYTLEGEV